MLEIAPQLLRPQSIASKKRGNIQKCPTLVSSSGWMGYWFYTVRPRVETETLMTLVRSSLQKVIEP